MRTNAGPIRAAKTEQFFDRLVSSVFFESSFTSVSTVNRGHPAWSLRARIRNLRICDLRITNKRRTWRPPIPFSHRTLSGMSNYLRTRGSLLSCSSTLRTPGWPWRSPPKIIYKAWRKMPRMSKGGSAVCLLLASQPWDKRKVHSL